MQQDNSFITDPNVGDLAILSSYGSEYEYRDDTVNNTEDSRASEISLLESSTIMPSILMDEKDDRKLQVKQVDEMRETLVKAINNLDINFKKQYDDDSFLDFAMLMALHSLELFLYKRAIGGIAPFAPTIERDIEDNDWSRIDLGGKIVDIGGVTRQIDERGLVMNTLLKLDNLLRE